MVVYAIVVATMIASSQVPKIPVMVASYSTLTQCRAELVEVSKLQGYELVVSPTLSYSVAKVTPEKTTTAFCVKDIRSI